MGSQQFCLKWNNHQSNLLAVFDQLLQNEAFVDVTLACEGLSLKAHKMVLSACSPYFQALFLDNPCKHPIVILNNIHYSDLTAIIDFMYKGEVNVSQDQLSALLKTAELLKVKGLAEVTNQTSQNIVSGGGIVLPPKPASPMHHSGLQHTSRASLSPPPKRKKLRTSAMSSAASSPQTPITPAAAAASASTSTPAVNNNSESVHEPKNNQNDHSLDGQSDYDGHSRNSVTEQNNTADSDLRHEPPARVVVKNEDHSPSTSNAACDSYDALAPDLVIQEPTTSDSGNVAVVPSTSGSNPQPDHRNRRSCRSEDSDSDDSTGESAPCLDNYSSLKSSPNARIDDSGGEMKMAVARKKKASKSKSPSSASLAGRANEDHKVRDSLELDASMAISESQLPFLPASHPLERTSVHRRCKVCHHLYHERHETALVCATCKIFICNPRRRGCYNIHTELAGYLRIRKGGKM